MTLALLGHALGAVGAACIVAAYFLLQTEKMAAKSLSYSLTNLVGAALLLVSLMIHFNLGSVLIELFWIAISVYGLIKALRRP